MIAKRDAAVKWCKQASDHAATYGGKPWEYLLIPHDVDRREHDHRLALLANLV